MKNILLRSNDLGPQANIFSEQNGYYIEWFEQFDFESRGCFEDWAEMSNQCQERKGIATGIWGSPTKTSDMKAVLRYMK